MLAGLLAQSSVSTGNTGPDWKLFLGFPAAVVALITIATYVLGRLHPLSITYANYWFEGEATKFACAIRNRSWFGDSTITALALIDVPSFVSRVLHPRWARTLQQTGVAPFGSDVVKIAIDGVTLTKRNERVFKGELRGPTGACRLTLSDRIRLQAQSGSKRSRRRRVTSIAPPPA